MSSHKTITSVALSALVLAVPASALAQVPWFMTTPPGNAPHVDDEFLGTPTQNASAGTLTWTGTGAPTWLTFIKYPDGLGYRNAVATASMPAPPNLFTPTTGTMPLTDVSPENWLMDMTSRSEVDTSSVLTDMARIRLPDSSTLWMTTPITSAFGLGSEFSVWLKVATTKIGTNTATLTPQITLTASTASSVTTTDPTTASNITIIYGGNANASNIQGTFTGGTGHNFTGTQTNLAYNNLFVPNWIGFVVSSNVVAFYAITENGDAVMIGEGTNWPATLTLSEFAIGLTIPSGGGNIETEGVIGSYRFYNSAVLP